MFYIRAHARTLFNLIYYAYVCKQLIITIAGVNVIKKHLLIISNL